MVLCSQRLLEILPLGKYCFTCRSLKSYSVNLEMVQNSLQDKQRQGRKNLDISINNCMVNCKAYDFFKKEWGLKD